MIITKENRTLEISGFDAAPNSFTIEQNSRAFEILSSNIYSDKITAVIREYSCNAYDAHIAAGKGDVPFEIHLPNSFEPWFSVEDFGTGLSHEAVLKLYTTYFSSTKNHSNELIGGLGLGSKSAFAYTDQFLITSKYNGEKRMYSAFIDEKGTPSITEINLAYSGNDHKSGLKIEFQVAPKDFKEFEGKVQTTLKYFPVKPNVSGIILDPPVEYLFKTDTFGIVEESGSMGSRVYAVQGIVSYPVDLRQVFPEGDSIRFLGLNCRGLVLFVPIGAVGITASREQLNYDVATRKYLQELLLSIPRTILGEISDPLEGMETMWEAKRYVWGWRDDTLQISGNEGSAIFHCNLLKDLTFGTKKTPLEIDTAIKFSIDKEPISMVEVSCKKKRRNWIPTSSSDPKDYTYQTRNTDTVWLYNLRSDQNPVMFLVERVEFDSVCFAKQYYLDHPELSDSTELLFIWPNKHLQVILDAFGNPPEELFLKVSDFEESEGYFRKDKVIRVTTEVRMARPITIDSERIIVKGMTKTEISKFVGQIAQGGVYIPFGDLRCNLRDTGFIHPTQNAITFGILKLEDVLVVSDAAKLLLGDNWYTPREFILKTLGELDHSKIEKLQTLNVLYTLKTNEMYADARRAFRYLSKLPPQENPIENSTYFQLLKDCDTLITEATDLIPKNPILSYRLEDLETLYRYLRVTRYETFTTLTDDTTPFLKRVELLREAYPLIVPTVRIDKVLTEEFYNYLNLCDLGNNYKHKQGEK